MPLRVEGLDHIVLRVADVEKSMAWYVDELGLEPLRLQEWRDKQVFFPSVRINPGTIIDILEAPRDGQNMDHVCLVLNPGTDMQAIVDAGRLDVAEGPVSRWGARGEAESVYVRDPDGNLVELRTYPPGAP